MASVNISLNGSKASFELNLVGQRTKQTYMGTFVCKCVLNPIEEVRADSLYREFLGNVNAHLASPRITDIAFALAQLKYRLVEFPQFWKSEGINGSDVDENVLITVLNICFEAQTLYENKSTERAKDLKEQLHNAIVNKEFEEQVAGVDEEAVLKESMDNVSKQLSEIG